MSARNHRQEVRLQDEEHELIQEAANYRGLSVPDYLRSTALENARMTLNEKNHFELSSRDWQMLITDLNNPPEPTDALVSLMGRRRS